MRLQKPRRNNPLRRGFTLVEAVLSVLIVTVMLGAGAAAVGGSARSQMAQQEQMRGMTLARQLLSEILQTAYQQPSAITLLLGPELLETRANYNDVDDFNGISESPPTDSSGTAIPGYTGWKRSVKVEWVDPTTLLPPFIQLESGVKRISVTVTAPTGRSWSLAAIRTKYGIYDKTVSTTYPSLVNVSIQIGSGNTSLASSRVNLVNQVP